MKTITRCLLVQILFAAWICAASTNEPPKAVGHRVKQDLTKWDANANGRLDRDEMEAFKKDSLRERQVQQDARARTAIDARKLDEAARRTRMVPPSLVKQYDSNSNSLIDLNEWKLYRQDVARQTKEKRAARLTAATNALNPASVVSTNTPSGP